MDAFRFGLIRRINDIREEWRTCDEPACRRARACIAESLACTAGRRTPTPEQPQRTLAKLYHMLQQRCDQAEKDPEDEAAAARGGEGARAGITDYHTSIRRPRS
jgi:hypothetical protein